MAKLSQFIPEETSTCYLYYPNGGPVHDKDGEPLWIEVYGEASGVFKNKQNAVVNRRIQKAQRGGKIQMTAEQQEAEDREIVVACTKDWNLEDEDDTPIPFSSEKADEVYRKYPKLYEAVLRHMRDEANFLPASSGT